MVRIKRNFITVLKVYENLWSILGKYSKSFKLEEWKHENWSMLLNVNYGLHFIIGERNLDDWKTMKTNLNLRL
jgi:hypothetical protein